MAMRDHVRKIGARIGSLLIGHLKIDAGVERSLILQGRILSNLNNMSQPRDLGDVEFRVFSQWGEDGIIDWLVRRIDVASARFVEFGVENFQEANCRFLLRNRNWKGLVLDGNDANIADIRRDANFWRHDLSARSAFLDAENINEILREEGFEGALGILSIDIDGNDYWVWEAIDCVDAEIVICEYNAVFGDLLPLSVPYDPNFRRFDAHYSGLYFGSSIMALRHLAQKKGYAFVGTNTSGVNAFFVRRDLAEPVLNSLSNIVCYPSRHRESRDRSGLLSYAQGASRRDIISDMPLVNVVTGDTVLMRDIETIYSDGWLKGMS